VVEPVSVPSEVSESSFEEPRETVLDKYTRMQER